MMSMIVVASFIFTANCKKITELFTDIFPSHCLSEVAHTEEKRSCMNGFKCRAKKFSATEIFRGTFSLVQIIYKNNRSHDKTILGMHKVANGKNHMIKPSLNFTKDLPVYMSCISRIKV